MRLAVLKAFVSKDRDFLYHLAQRDMLDNIFMTLCDDNPQIQEAVVGLLGVLAELNPAYVYPKLRRQILESIGQLSSSKINNFEEQSAKCIAVLAETSPKFVMPYMDSILSALEPHLSQEKRTVGVTFHVLNALSHLASLGGMDIVKHLPLLFKPLLQYLQDSTSLSRREVRDFRNPKFGSRIRSFETIQTFPWINSQFSGISSSDEWSLSINRICR